MAADYRVLVAIDLKGTDRLPAEAKRYGQAFNAAVDIMRVFEPDRSEARRRRCVGPPIDTSDVAHGHQQL